jgi:hypothetical protein
MTKEDIIKLAIEHTVSGLKFDEDGLLRFAKLIAEQEREACAKVCDERAQKKDLSNHRRCDADLLASAIRARGQA